MSARSVFLVVVGALALCAGTASSQQTLGSFVTDGGYDWIIGRWVAADDENKPEITYKWVLDKHAALMEVKMGEFKLRGIVMLSPETGEVTEVAADNRGGTWKGDWTDDSGDLVYRLQQTDANGEVNKAEVVHSKVDADTITVALYGVDGSGARNSEAMSKVTYKRQSAASAVPAAVTTQAGRSTEYQKLGDLVAQGGYDWMLGKWLASDDDRQYGLEHTWVLDRHAVLVDLKMGDFTYHGMIMCVPSRQEIIQVGADNMVGVWKGTWEQSGEGATHKVAYTGADGMTRKMEHVYSKTDSDTFQVKEFSSQSSEARRTLTFKRQKAAPAAK
ncbi:MAG: hypothetical protein ABFE01_14340 [Phycisphaerales bacterium]